MEDKIELVVSGITVNEVKYGAYALILSEVDGERSIPVVVGPAEAQSIAAKLNGSVYPRPLSHDVFASAFKAFGIEVKSVYIYKFEKGIFYSEINMVDKYTDEREVTIDSRTSDAVAIALRADAPIFAAPEVVEKTGIIMTDQRSVAKKSKVVEDESLPLSRYSDEQVEKMMKRCVLSD